MKLDEQKASILERHNTVVDLCKSDIGHYYLVQTAQYDNPKPNLPRFVKLESDKLNKSTLQKIMDVIGGDLTVSISYIGYMSTDWFEL